MPQLTGQVRKGLGRNEPSGGNIALRVQYTVQIGVLVVSGLLLARFLLALFGLSSSHLIVSGLFSMTQPFVEMLNGETYTGIARFEAETLIAMITIALSGLLIVWLLGVYAAVTEK
jgi:hypothetical protein